MSKFTVQTLFPVALDSEDHQIPGGTMHDNSVNKTFNDKLYQIVSGNLRVMDLGCAGGGFVKSLLDDGHLAIGLEGSDYSYLRKRAEWATIPDSLFLCDVTRPFTVCEDDKPVKFDVITAWEVMEHLPDERLDVVISNAFKHLKDTGLWIMSVSEQYGQYHVTVKPKEWWLERLSKHGFVNDDSLVAHFGNDWIRGPHQNAPESFHLVARKSP